MEAEMTDEQINVAIAEACGWTDIHDDPTWGWLGRPPKSSGSGWPILPYCECLNAMHDAEKILGNWLPEYGIHLYKMTLANQSDLPECYIWHATARQRAEAFLRTLGRWEE